jgi:putative ABC transport system permease protein
MAPAATLSSAEADINGVAAQLASVFPATNAGHGVALEPLRDALVGRDLQLTSFLLVGVVGFVLLICCANVANLLLGRGAARAREFAIRSSLGAGRRRLVRQLLTESLVLAALGGGLGAAVGAAILSAAPSLLPDDLLPAAVTLHFDARVLVFCAATALIVGLAFGLAPAWQTGTLASPLAQRTGTADRHGATVRRILVTGEVAAAVVVLFGAGLLLRTLVAVSTVDRGYRAQGVLTMLVDPLGSKYPTPASLLQFYGDIEREVAAVPGVRSVAWAGTLPMGYSEGGRYFFEVAGSPAPPADERPSADYQIVSPAYFDTIDLPILAGRAFTDHDTPDSVPVCIVNEAFARMYLRGRNPIGARVAVRSVARPQSPAVVREVVGIARQVKERPDETTDLVQIYVPMAQDTIDDIFLVLRPLSGRAADLAQSVRRAIGRVDKEQLVSVREVMTLEAIEREATGRHRFRAEFFVAFGALALVLAMVGVFGVLANAVQSRTREFGVRRVLGATSAEVIRPLVASAIRLVLVGTAIGLALALGFGRLLSAVLFGVQPLDPITFAGIALLLACTGVVSALAPAWRAARIDPAVALRSE